MIELIPDFDIVFIGHFSKDVIITHRGTVTGPGGAVYYGSIAAAGAGARAAVITKAADEDDFMLKPMKDAGVTVFRVGCEKTTGIENRYLDETMERRVCRPVAFAGEYAAEMLPGINSRVWHVAGLIKGEAGPDLLRHLSGRGKLSADAQGFVRVIRGEEMVYEDWPEKKEMMPLMDFFKVDAAEAEILTGETDVEKAAAALSAMGAKEVVLTHPGGLLAHADGKFFNTPFTPREMKGRTGRGDTCMASYLYWRMSHTAAEAGRFAATLCSIKMEAEGPFSGTLDEVLSRMNES